MRVRGGGEGDAPSDETVEEARGGILLGDGLEPARRGALHRHVDVRRGRGHGVPEFVGPFGDVAGDLDEVGVGQDVDAAGGAEFLQGGGVLGPDLVDVPTTPLVHVHRVVDVVELPGAEPVHRTDQHVEGVLAQ